MKYLIVASSILLFVAAQCQKDNPEGTTVIPEPIDTIPTTPPVFRDTLAVWKNGERWDGIMSGLFYDPLKRSRFYLKAEKKRSNSLTEWFFIKDIPCLPGSYRVEYGWPASALNNNIPQANFAYVVDGDQGAGTYYVDSTQTRHVLNVLRYDSSNNIVEGSFNIALKLKTIPAVGIPDTISMTNGYFKVKIKQ